MVTIHFYIIVIILMKKLMGFETVRLPTLFFYIPQMKEKHRGLEQHVKKWWKNFHFGVNWPFKCLLQYRYIYQHTHEWMNASMMHLYCAVLCIAVHPKHFTIMWGGGGSPHPPPVSSIHLDDATAATGQQCQCTHHTPATGGRGERDGANQVDGDY